MTCLNTSEEKEIKSNHSFNGTFLGYYNSATSRGQIARFIEFLTPYKRLYKHDGKYFLQSFMGQKTELKVLSPSLLSRRNDLGYEYTYVFISDDRKKYLQIPMLSENFIQTTFVDAWARILIPFTILLLFLIGLVTTSVLIIQKILKSNSLHLFLLVATWLSMLSFFTMFYFLMTGFLINMVELLGKPSFFSKGYYICNLSFITSGVLSIVFLFLKWRKRSRKNKFYYSILLFGFVITVIYLSFFELNGLKTWEY